MNRPAWDLGTRIVTGRPPLRRFDREGRTVLGEQWRVEEEPASPARTGRPLSRPLVRATSTRDDRCGSPAGYQVHRRRREPACADCRDAVRVYNASLKAGGGAGEG